MIEKAEVLKPGSELPETTGGGIGVELLRMAGKDSGIDVELIREFRDIYERDRDYAAKQLCFAAMNKVQAELKAVDRDGTNEQTHSKYAKRETMIAAIRPIYTKYGFSVSHNEAKEAPREGETRYLATCQHEGGYEKEFHVDLPLDDKGFKGTANKTAVHAKKSSSTYAEGILEARIFNVAFGKDDDGNAAGDPADATPLTAARLQDIKRRIDECGSTVAKVCKSCEVKTLAEIPDDKYYFCVGALQARKESNERDVEGK